VLTLTAEGGGAAKRPYSGALAGGGAQGVHDGEEDLGAQPAVGGRGGPRRRSVSSPRRSQRKPTGTVVVRAHGAAAARWLRELTGGGRALEATRSRR
jgi:hypothetical protein